MRGPAKAPDEGRCDISVFLAEQGLQLFLRARLLRVQGDYRSPESGIPNDLKSL